MICFPFLDVIACIVCICLFVLPSQDVIVYFSIWIYPFLVCPLFFIIKHWDMARILTHDARWYPPTHLISVRPYTDSVSNIIGIYILISLTWYSPHTYFAYILVSNTRFNVLLALKIGEEVTEGWRCIWGAKKKNSYDGSTWGTKDNYVMIGLLSSVV